MIISDFRVDEIESALRQPSTRVLVSSPMTRPARGWQRFVISVGKIEVNVVKRAHGAI
jgi:hypothetical protein